MVCIEFGLIEQNIHVRITYGSARWIVQKIEQSIAGFARWPAVQGVEADSISTQNRHGTLDLTQYVVSRVTMNVSHRKAHEMRSTRYHRVSHSAASDAANCSA